MNKKYGFAGFLLAVSVVTGCSSITKGTDQEIIVNTNPAGASCELKRNGQTVGIVPNTPGTATVSKTKDDITVICNKEGFQQATYHNESGWESGSGAGGIALDVLLTLGMSSLIDSATGADNRYDGAVNINLIPISN